MMHKWGGGGGGGEEADDDNGGGGGVGERIMMMMLVMVMKMMKSMMMVMKCPVHLHGETLWRPCDVNVTGFQLFGLDTISLPSLKWIKRLITAQSITCTVLTAQYLLINLQQGIQHILINFLITTTASVCIVSEMPCTSSLYLRPRFIVW